MFSTPALTISTINDVVVIVSYIAPIIVTTYLVLKTYLTTIGAIEKQMALLEFRIAETIKDIDNLAKKIRSLESRNRE